MIYPDFETIRKTAVGGKYKTAPVSLEILSDFTTPIEVLRILKNVSDHCFLLESINDNEKWGRYTFLGFDPKLEITCLNGHMKIGDLEFETDDPGKYIRQIVDQHKSASFEGLPTFTGGLMGYFSYDYLKYSEKSLNLDAEDSEGFNDVDVMMFDRLICFDNYRQKIILIVNISLEHYETEYNRAQMELRNLEDLIRHGTPAADTPGRLKSEIRSLFSKDQFCSMVEKAKYHIKEGDIFQIVLSNRLDADYEGTLLNFYRMIRTINPSPYMFYLSSSTLETAGASPETLVKIENGVLHTFPLAGTRPRGATPEEDRRMEQELLADPKELAEHNMLVDLGRNDLGKVSKFGSVEVETLHEVLRYSHVMHIGSTVRGELAVDKTPLDAVASVLPAGTLSGAPKIRACQLINDIEKNKRGIYGGAIGYIDFKQNLDLCIGIRIAYCRNHKVFVRSGAGIVADSVPETEYQECLNKAAAVIDALRKAEELTE